MPPPPQESRDLMVESVADEELDFEPEEQEEEDEKSREKRRQLEIQKEIKALKKELKGGGGGKGQKAKAGEKEGEEGEGEADRLTEEERANDMLRAFHEEQSKYASKKTSVPKKGSKREDMTLQLLSKFKQKLHTVKSDDAGEEPKKAPNLEADLGRNSIQSQ